MGKSRVQSKHTTVVVDRPRMWLPRIEHMFDPRGHVDESNYKEARGKNLGLCEGKTPRREFLFQLKGMSFKKLVEGLYCRKIKIGLNRTPITEVVHVCKKPKLENNYWYVFGFIDDEVCSNCKNDLSTFTPFIQLLVKMKVI